MRNPFLFLTLLAPILLKFGFSVKILCFCMKFDGRILLLKTEPSGDERAQYSFPGLELAAEEGMYAFIKNTLNEYGITGKTEEKLLYTGPEDREGRSVIFRVRVKEVRDDLTEDSRRKEQKMWCHLEEAAGLVANNPNPDYESLFRFLLRNPSKIQLEKKGGIYKSGKNYILGTALICTDAATGNVLLVRQMNGKYNVPQDMWPCKGRRTDVLKAPERLMTHLGIYGSIYDLPLGEVEIVRGRTKTRLSVFHVTVLSIYTSGRCYRVRSRDFRGSPSDPTKAVSYDSNARIWFNPVVASQHIRDDNAKFLPFLNEVLDKLRSGSTLSCELPPKRDNNIGETSSSREGYYSDSEDGENAFVII